MYRRKYISDAKYIAKTNHLQIQVNKQLLIKSCIENLLQTQQKLEKLILTTSTYTDITLIISTNIYLTEAISSLKKINENNA